MLGWGVSPTTDALALCLLPWAPPASVPSRALGHGLGFGRTWQRSVTAVHGEHLVGKELLHLHLSASPWLCHRLCPPQLFMPWITAVFLEPIIYC